jgi:hypothetical protein
MKAHELSPEKYVKTKARALPIYKCLINANWEASKMAQVIVMRKHVNDNVTAGMYLVDLLCLGVKDSHYRFNIAESQIMENLAEMDFLTIDYPLAHNIIFAGHDFAMEFEIAPHKSFDITQHILEEDNDNIPLIDVHTGDENGLPLLMTETTYAYKPILAKLKKNAGEGNYHVQLIDRRGMYVEDDDGEDWGDDDGEDWGDDDGEDWEDDEDESENSETLSESNENTDWADYEILPNATNNAPAKGNEE